MGDFLLCFSLWEWVWSYHKSEESSLVFVDSIQPPSRCSCAGCTGPSSQPHLPAPLMQLTDSSSLLAEGLV